MIIYNIFRKFQEINQTFMQNRHHWSPFLHPIIVCNSIFQFATFSAWWIHTLVSSTISLRGKNDRNVLIVSVQSSSCKCFSHHRPLLHISKRLWNCRWHRRSDTHVSLNMSIPKVCSFLIQSHVPELTLLIRSDINHMFILLYGWNQ